MKLRAVGVISKPKREDICSVAPGLQLTREVRSGPLRVDALEVDRSRLSGRLTVALSSRRVAGRRTTSSISGAERGLAAVNGGFFASRGRWNM